MESFYSLLYLAFLGVIPVTVFVLNQLKRRKPEGEPRKKYSHMLGVSYRRISEGENMRLTRFSPNSVCISFCNIVLGLRMLYWVT
jgi:hypothetical protein